MEEHLLMNQLAQIIVRKAGQVFKLGALPCGAMYAYHVCACLYKCMYHQ